MIQANLTRLFNGGEMKCSKLSKLMSSYTVLSNKWRNWRPWWNKWLLTCRIRYKTSLFRYQSEEILHFSVENLIFRKQSSPTDKSLHSSILSWIGVPRFNNSCSLSYIESLIAKVPAVYYQHHHNIAMWSYRQLNNKPTIIWWCHKSEL